MADLGDNDPADAEIELIRRAQGGDEEAFGELVRANHEGVFRRVVTITRNDEDARDVGQEIWVTVWRCLKDYRGEAKFSTWLYAVATRRAIDHLRKRRRWFDRFLPFLAEGGTSRAVDPASLEAGPREHFERAEDSDRFQRAIDALPAKHRAVLALREIEGLSYDEIAETLHCKRGTVMSRLFNARRMLAQKLEDLPCD